MYFVVVVCCSCVDAWSRPVITNLDIMRMVYASDILGVEPKESIFNMVKKTFVVRTHM